MGKTYNKWHIHVFLLKTQNLSPGLIKVKVYHSIQDVSQLWNTSIYTNENDIIAYVSKSQIVESIHVSYKQKTDSYAVAMRRDVTNPRLTSFEHKRVFSQHCKEYVGI